MGQLLGSFIHFFMKKYLLWGKAVLNCSLPSDCHRSPEEERAVRARMSVSNVSVFCCLQWKFCFCASLKISFIVTKFFPFIHLPQFCDKCPAPHWCLNNCHCCLAPACSSESPLEPALCLRKPWILVQGLQSELCSLRCSYLRCSSVFLP